MAAPIDIHLLPVARSAGHDYPELLSIYAGDPPRRRARGREQDRLVLYLAMAGNAPLPPGKQEDVLADLAKLYYATPGSVTAAMRQVAEELNKVLLERNRLLSASSRVGLAVLVQVAARGEQLTLGLSGPAQVFHLSAAGVSVHSDPEQALRGLGQVKATPLGFFQTRLETGDTLLLSAQPAPDWSEDTLAGLHGQGPESLRRRLFGPSLTDVNVVLLQARPGKGVINLPKPGKLPVATESKPAGEPAPSGPTPTPAPAAPVVAAPAETAVLEPPAGAALESEPLQAGGVEVFPAVPVSPLAAPVVPQPPAPVSSATETVQFPETNIAPAESAPLAPDLAGSPPAAAGPAAEPRERRSLSPGKALAAVGAALIGALAAVGRGLRSILVRILPEEALSGIPSTVMAFTAVAVPIVIVTMASIAYTRLGVDTEYERLFAQARQMGQRAATQTDLGAKYSDLNSAWKLTGDAEKFGRTAETQALRASIRGMLDEMELIRRVDYRPAIIGGLPQAARITRLAAIDDNLYMLDASTGAVLHARLTGQGYRLNPEFACSASAGPPGLGQLVDMAIWPLGWTPEGNLLAMDSSANVIHCRNGGPPDVEHPVKTARPAVEAFGDLIGFALDNSGGFVLDGQSGNVWIYPQSNFDQAPRPFFNAEPPDLKSVVDMTVNRDDLYLLGPDGKLTLCTYSAFVDVVPTRCTQPSYIDRRPGREGLPLTPSPIFALIQSTQPPDPALFLLDAGTQSIYHFSQRNLTFQWQYSPQDPLTGGSATAFAVDNVRRYLFLALGNQIYYAIMP